MAPWGWPLIVLGIVLALVSLFADRLGLGAEPGFGWKQTVGVVVGVALAALGAWRRR
jgi:uncharacterized membrane protein